MVRTFFDDGPYESFFKSFKHWKGPSKENEFEFDKWLGGFPEMQYNLSVNRHWRDCILDASLENGINLYFNLLVLTVTVRSKWSTVDVTLNGSFWCKNHYSTTLARNADGLVYGILVTSWRNKTTVYRDC